MPNKQSTFSHVLTMDRPCIDYPVEATSVEGFVQQVAVSFLPNSYFFFVSGWVPHGKDPKSVDTKLLERYSIAISKWSRARRKEAGSANIQYIRFGSLFLLMATHGKHRFFEAERGVIKDARRTPIRAFGYAITFRGGHSHVRIEMNEYKRFRAHILDLAKHRSKVAVESAFLSAPYQAYAPVRRQLINIWRAANRVRKEAGYELLAIECIRMRRRIVKPFEKVSDSRIESKNPGSNEADVSYNEV
ncbi:MAG: hypothetical protein JST12_08990 [Armatimonadetes bacterium]|nr:hypothetical protein [Armatimonadota bacterium]